MDCFDLELTFSLFFFFLSAISFKADLFSSLIPWEKRCPEGWLCAGLTLVKLALVL